MAHHAESWTQRTKPIAPAHELAGSEDLTPQLPRPGSFHHAHTSLGVAGHIVHMGSRQKTENKAR
jgi:hypothetical protein